MARPRFVPLPPARVASSRLAWRIARAIAARGRGWSVDQLAVSRRWRFQVGRSRWIAHAFVLFIFRDSARRGSVQAVYAIHFEGTGSASELEGSALVQDLRGRLGTFHTYDAGKQLAWKLVDESRPRRLLAEIDRIAQAFGSDDRHHVPPSRSRALGKRLAVVADAILAHGTWGLEGPSVWIQRDDAVYGTISPMPSSDRGRAELYSQVMFVSDGKPLTAHVARAEAHGYVDHAGKVADVAPCLGKLQPLSLRAALTEARFIESEVTRRAGTATLWRSAST